MGPGGCGYMLFIVGIIPFVLGDSAFFFFVLPIVLVVVCLRSVASYGTHGGSRLWILGHRLTVNLPKLLNLGERFFFVCYCANDCQQRRRRFLEG